MGYPKEKRVFKTKSEFEEAMLHDFGTLTEYNGVWFIDSHDTDLFLRYLWYAFVKKEMENRDGRRANP